MRFKCVSLLSFAPSSSSSALFSAALLARLEAIAPRTTTSKCPSYSIVVSANPFYSSLAFVNTAGAQLFVVDVEVAVALWKKKIGIYEEE